MIETIKESWFVFVAIICMFAFIFTLCWSSGHASQIILDRHGYHMTWWQATFVDVEELVGNQSFDVNVGQKK
jgi:hypothetical protein